MQIKTKAIVLHRRAYTDRYQIVDLYTESYGRLGVLIPTGRSKRHQCGSLLLSPLAELEFVGELKRGKQLATPTELRLYRPNYGIQQSPIKCSQGLFISELLYRILSEGIADASLYHFVAESLHLLHHLERGVANFYLCFVYRLLYHLAIEPTIEPSPSAVGRWFDLGEARFTHCPHISTPTIPPHHERALYCFSRISYANMHRYRYNREERAVIIDYLLTYYRLHLPSFGEIKSLAVLRNASRATLPTVQQNIS